LGLSNSSSQACGSSSFSSLSHLPPLSKTEQIVAVTNAILTLRISAIVLHEATQKSFIATRTFGSKGC